MGNISRRDLIRFSALGMSGVVVSTGLMGCGGDDDDAIDVSFTHGVASGDPQPDRVILWTRVVPERRDLHETLAVQFEVATDEAFSSVTHSGNAMVSVANDYTLKVDAQNLSPNQEYFYRFRAYGVESPVGKTKTLPAAEASLTSLKMAVFSCSNYPTGYFHAYSEAAKLPDIDVSLHLGDYIYEYKMGQYATDNAEMLGRSIPAENDVELVTLADYRARYALYRTDPGLQALHAHAPMIVVPDDHEVANDTWAEGAENHDPETEGDFFERKQAALKAYFEWMPIRPFQEGDEETLYRQFQFGQLVNLMMLDTRLAGRSEQLSLTDPAFFNPDGSFNATAFVQALSDSSRTMLGADQLQWLLGTMASSSSTWQVLGQQVLMARMNIPMEVLLQLGGGDIASVLGELVTIKARISAGDPTVTEQERARVATAAPYNLDAWDGYQYEREIILSTAAAQQQKLLVLAGDTHNAWASNLTLMDGTVVGVELATSSVTSPGMENYLGLDDQSALALEQGLQILIDDLQYTNLKDRGFMVLHFMPEQVETEWVFIEDITAETATVLESRSKRIEIGADAVQIGS